jgi:formate hydrogenlyase subunit 6/NADH:ubiquinone oxidoreductase subunit I
MVLDKPGNCIGCSACARVCPKDCQTHVKASELGL